MQKNWYILYTKPKCEKKVSHSLTRKKIENFCPQNRKQIKHNRRIKTILEPLFGSYVFVHIEKEKLPAILLNDNVLSLVYWKGSPAVIKNEEIEMMNKFIGDHDNVKLEKSKVDLQDSASVIDRPTYKLNGNLLTIKNKTLKVYLPSLGYTLTAEHADEKTLRNETSFLNKELLLQ